MKNMFYTGPHCPSCGSEDISRIGLYEYQCDACGDVFDINECSRSDIDEFDGPDDEEDFDNEKEPGHLGIYDPIYSRPNFEDFNIEIQDFRVEVYNLDIDEDGTPYTVRAIDEQTADLYFREALEEGVFGELPENWDIVVFPGEPADESRPVDLDTTLDWR